MAGTFHFVFYSEDLFYDYGCEDRLRNLMKMVYMHDDGDSFTDYSWERVFSIRENVYKEWCLEFFSTMYFERKVDWSKIMEEKCVWFRLCRREHAYTFLEFAVILGLYTQSDIKHQLFRIRFSRLARNGKTFEHIEYWNRIGDPNDGRKKLSQFYDPFMQVLHKLIIGAFVHRSDDWNASLNEVERRDVWRDAIMMKIDYQSDYAILLLHHLAYDVVYAIPTAYALPNVPPYPYEVGGFSRRAYRGEDESMDSEDMDDK
ncbi:hypothetical protein Tco_0228599 [Tanacetum coccineum]